MRMFIEINNGLLLDISENQIMLGYNPLLIGFESNQIEINGNHSSKKKIILRLGKNENEIIAKLWMEEFQKIELNSDLVTVFKGVKGKGRFKNKLHSIIGDFYYSLTANKTKNIYLKGNLYMQVKIAYSIPRKIYLISLGTNGLFNIFPTDISGKINEEHFAISLRTNGRANQQLEKIGKCLLVEMHSDTCKEVYSLGKNHMFDLVAADQLNIKLNNEPSEQFNLPVPKLAVKYTELQKVKTIEAGIHTIHFMKIENSVELSDVKSTLAHIHRDYAEWRIKNKLQTDLFFR